LNGESAATWRGTATVYLEIQGRNPTRVYLDRYSEHQPPVKPGSPFFCGSRVLCQIGRIKLMREDSAQVYGGYYEGNHSAFGNT